MKKMSGMKALEMDEMPEPVRYHVGPESVKSVKRSGVKAGCQPGYVFTYLGMYTYLFKKLGM